MAGAGKRAASAAKKAAASKEQPEKPTPSEPEKSIEDQLHAASGRWVCLSIEDGEDLIGRVAVVNSKVVVMTVMEDGKPRGTAHARLDTIKSVEIVKKPTNVAAE
jgi:hypothetical protein